MQKNACFCHFFAVLLGMINNEKINNKGNKMTKEAIQLEEKRTYYEAVNNLLENIKIDYAKWTTWEEGIERFNNGIRTEDGKKYTKVIQGTSVWGFIAKADGVVKGVPCKKGDVFKAAGWRGPARYTRGNIFAENQNYFQWTGPNYLR